MATVEFHEVTRTFPAMDRPAVDRFDLKIADGEILVLVGPSGCGKSTVLRMLAGLEPVDAGRITIDGLDVTDVPARDRDIAMVFQAYALYPHMTVAENIAFHLTLDNERPAEVRRRVAAVADLLGISELLGRRPSKLSGGQRQRVAMGRALIRHPKVLLMDEPLSNLDAKLRLHMRTEIAMMQKRLGTTTMYVTHDQVEAMTLGDRVAVQRDGVLLQCAPPMELYDEPIDEFVAGFIGSPAMNLIGGRIVGDMAVAGGIRQCLSRRQLDVLGSNEVTLGVRPEAWTIGGCGGIDVEVGTVESLGAETFLNCATPDIPELIVRTAGGSGIAVGDHLDLRPNPGEVHVFDAETHRRIAR